MTSVDNRIVSMEFDNSTFETKMAATLKSLDKLSESLKLTGSKSGFEDVNKAAAAFDTTHMASAVENISHKFSALGAIGFSVIQGLTQHVLGFVSHIANVAKTDILGPIITGGTTRATNIEQAKFQFRGLGIDVDKAMKSSLDAVLGTAFGLDEAAKIAAQFGASGMQAGAQMTGALRGIAGAAAMTGKSFSEIGDIFAQSAASGVVNTMDLQQFASRGLNAAASVAKVLGKTEAQVRDMASHGKLDFNTFATAMDKAFGKHATEANQTYTGALANLHAAMSRLGASFEGPKLQQQRDLFNALSPQIDNVSAALQPLIGALLKIRGIGVTNLIQDLNHLNLKDFKLAVPNFADAIKNAFAGATQFLGIIKTAFHEIFPPNTTSTLLAISVAIKNLSEHLKMGSATAQKVKDIFAGLFATFQIIWTVLKELVVTIASLLGHLSPAGGGALSLAAKFGVWLQVLNNMLVAGGAIHRFFVTLRTDLEKPIDFIAKLTGGVINFFRSFENVDGPATAALGRVNSRLDNLGGAFDRLHTVFDGVKKVLNATWDVLSKWFSELGQKIKAVLKPGDFNSAVDAVNAGLLGGIVVLLNKFINHGFSIDFKSGIFGQAQMAFRNLTGTLKAMQAELKAETLMKIAIAVGVLTASILILSLINSEALTKALTAIAVGFAQLVGVMKLLDEISSSIGGAAKLSIVAGGMILLAGAAVILSIAIKELSGLSWGELSKGLVGVAGAMIILVAAAKVVEGDAAGMIAAGIAMDAIAASMVILASAVKIFGTMSWGEIAKGLVSVAVALGVIAGVMQIMPVASTLAAGLAMIPMAIGLTILAGAVKLFGLLSWTEIIKGMVGIGAGLVIIAGAMQLMPLTLPITAAGLVIVATALNIMAGAVALMGNMDFGTILKGLSGLAVMLLIVAAGTNAMTGALPGAAALLVVSASLLIMTHVLEELGKLKIVELVTGLAAIASMLLLLGGAAILLGPAIPLIMSLGLALLVVGAGFALFGAGAFLVAKAFEAVISAIKSGAADLVTGIRNILNALVMAVLDTAAQLLKSSDLIVRVLGTLLLDLLDTVIKLVPKIAETIGTIISAGVKLLREHFPELITAGIDILLTLLTALDTHMPEITQKGADILVRFIEGISKNSQQLVNAAFDLITNFLNSIGDRAADIELAGLNVLVHLLTGIINNLIHVVNAVSRIIDTFITAIGNALGRIISSGVNLLLNFLEGIGRNISRVATKGTDVAIAFVNAIASNAIRFANAAADALVNFLNGLAGAIRSHSGELRSAGLNIASAIIDGMTFGLASKAGHVADAALNVAKGAVGGVLNFLHVKSPSKLFFDIGANMALGMAQGLSEDTTAENSAVAHAERIVAAFQETLNRVPDSLAGLDASPVITPILDLSRVTEAARGINGLMPTPTISPDASFGQARLLSIMAADLAASKANLEPAKPPSEIKFEQNIHAPEALSTNDIYRNTRSQIALAKEELNI